MSTTAALMLSEYNHMPFFMVMHDEWNVADEMLFLDDADGGIGAIRDPDGDVLGGGGRIDLIDIAVFYKITCVLYELVKKIFALF